MLFQLKVPVSEMFFLHFWDNKYISKKPVALFDLPLGFLMSSLVQL